MSEAERLVAALRRIWSDLPILAGDDWKRLRDQLEELIRTRHKQPDSVVAAKLRSALAPWPAAYERLLVSEQVEAEGDNRTRGVTRSAEREPEQPERPAPEPRYVNLAVLREADYGRLRNTKPLETDRPYFLRLDIGASTAESVVEDREPFPVRELPRSETGHWLEIGVTSADFDVPEETFPIFLPTAGPSWVCACEPRGPHRCRKSDREQYLLVPVTAPPRPGPAVLRVSVWYLNNLVQSFVLTADVVADPTSPGGHAARIDYTLTEELVELDTFEPRALGVLVNESGHATHTLVFNDGSGGTLSFVFTESAVTAAMEDFRELLLGFHQERVGNARRNLLGARNEKAPAAFAGDLERLTRFGWRCWVSLFPQQPDRLPAVSKSASSTIHVARVPSTLLVYPVGGDL